jgi:class 3 adenylate cyclase
MPMYMDILDTRIAVAELCIGKALPFADVGRIPLKGFDQPVHVHAVGFAATA